MGTKCNQDAYVYLTQACAIALEYLHQIDLVYVPGKRDQVVAAIKAKLKKARRAQNTMVPCQHKFFSSTEFGFVECKYCGATYPIEAQHQ